MVKTGLINAPDYWASKYGIWILSF